VTNDQINQIIRIGQSLAFPVCDRDPAVLTVQRQLFPGLGHSLWIRIERLECDRITITQFGGKLGVDKSQFNNQSSLNTRLLIYCSPRIGGGAQR